LSGEKGGKNGFPNAGDKNYKDTDGEKEGLGQKTEKSGAKKVVRHKVRPGRTKERSRGWKRKGVL